MCEKTNTMRENDLAVLAKRFRRQAGTTRAQAARDMKVSQTSIFNAEETPDQALVKLRMRMIEAYSKFKVRGAVLFLKGRMKSPYLLLLCCMDIARNCPDGGGFSFALAVLPL